MDEYIKAFQRTFGLYLFMRRKELGLTQKQVSEKIGIRRSEVSAIEVGRNTNIQLITLLKMLYALDLQIDIVPEKERAAQ